MFLAPPRAVAQVAAPAAERLGFARYLPEDTVGYVSFMQLGNLQRSLAASRAWHEVAGLPEVATLVEQARTALTSDEIPSELRTALALLVAAGDTELTLATSPEVSHKLLTLGRVGLLSIILFSPQHHPPGSPDAVELEALREPLRKQWLAAASEVGLPSFVVAARIRGAAQFDGFVRGMVAQAWQGVLTDLSRRRPPPPVQAALDAALTEVRIGETTFTRFRLNFGDFFSKPDLLREFEKLPIGEEERRTAAEAVASLTVDVHLGFVGEYLTLAVGSNDKLIRQIVDGYEGRSAATLAASAAFAPIRAELSRDTIGVLFVDGVETHRELQTAFLPALEAVSDEKLLTLLGAPPAARAVIRRVQSNLKSAALATPIRRHEVLKIDEGLRQSARAEYDREPTPPPATPLAAPNLVPATAVGFAARRDLSLDPLWEQLHVVIEQQQAELRSLADRYPGGEFAQRIFEQHSRLEEILMPIDDKLVGALRGETTLVAGGVTKLAIQDDPDTPVDESAGPFRDLPVPMAALVVRSPDPDKAIAGLVELFHAVAALSQSGRVPGPLPPLSLAPETVEGLEIWRLEHDGAAVEGVVPHLTRIGDLLVVSSSLELTRQLRDTSAGKAPGIATTPAYQAVAEHLPPTALQLGYVDGVAVQRGLKTAADGLFAAFAAEDNGLLLTDRDREEMAQVKRFVDVGLKVFGCFRGAVESTVVDGRTEVTRQWIHVADLEP